MAPVLVLILILVEAAPVAVSAQQSATVATPLVFDEVTVVDVEQGKLVPGQRVVIVGNRIQAVENIGTAKTPKGAQVVNAQGKYLIPGLWDLHVHPMHSATDFFYPLFIANGVTGIRDASSSVPLDTLVQWRREILAGTRVGPPRQILSGQAIDESESCTREAGMHTCVAAGDTADARHLVDSLKAAGVDMIKTYALSKEMYFVIAAEARRIGIPFGGHLSLYPEGPSAASASDSGASIVDHVRGAGDLSSLCMESEASVERCQPVAERFRRNGTWWVPTLVVREDTLWFITTMPAAARVHARLLARNNRFLAGLPVLGNWLLDSAALTAPRTLRPDSTAGRLGYLHIIRRAGLPILAGTDAVDADPKPPPPGSSLHAELAIYVAEGLTPLDALQSATLNPAKFLHATDSLGTVASGKLADLVLLDADPLADITNTTTIRAVVANGRYYDRAALDQLLAEAQATGKGRP